jgi:uncharacterized protein
VLEQQLEADIKAALLARDSVKVTTLRGLKAMILSTKVANSSRGEMMPDADVIAIFSKAAKQRQESADLYVQGGNQAMADAELTEKALIETYLPAQLDEAAIADVIESVVAETGATDMKSMGVVIAGVKAKTAGAADGAVIARLVKARLG